MARLKNDIQNINHIFEASRNVVIKVGFNGLKMADVAKESNLATGTLYLYFKNKEDLINQTYLSTKKNIAEILLFDKNENLSFEQAFKKMWLAYFHFCKQFPAKILFVEQFLYSGFLDEKILEEAENFFEPLNNFLKFGIDNHLLKNIDYTILKAQLTGAIHEIIKINIKQKKELTEKEIDICFEMAWQATKLN
ncbi:MAG: TetR/AcrR family transcriptional regulator [Bacteroidetes bacterium]|nr:MAG: TetR/AcrR family transcriptional regulator [Bacteroidota bacterium]TAG87567.1 MAG: TetR/AcrR family transcriptional regulator [Bacteroidota bacterium]